MRSILTADWHLTDHPADAYRWDVFDALNADLQKHGPACVYVLGDITDRKDKHSATLVNALAEGFTDLHSHALKIVCLMGNHDKPMKGVPFWNVLNELRDTRINFVSKPHRLGDVMLLPYSDDPAAEWAGLDMVGVRMALLHQPLDGARMESGRLHEGGALPRLPRGMRIYSGDMHVPQTVGRVEYVGAPHPIKYGDGYRCRMLELDKDYKISREIILQPPAKAVVEIGMLDELPAYELRNGDSAKFRVNIESADAADWPKMEADLRTWAKRAGVHVSSIEAVVAQDATKGVVNSDALMGDPEAILAGFLDAEGIGKDDLRRAHGFALMKQAMGAE